MLVLVVLLGLSVVILVLLFGERISPVSDGPLRQTNVFVVVTFTGTVAVHTILKVLYGITSRTSTDAG